MLYGTWVRNMSNGYKYNKNRKYIAAFVCDFSVQTLYFIFITFINWCSINFHRQNLFYKLSHTQVKTFKFTSVHQQLSPLPRQRPSLRRHHYRHRMILLCLCDPVLHQPQQSKPPLRVFLSHIDNIMPWTSFVIIVERDVKSLFLSFNWKFSLIQVHEINLCLDDLVIGWFIIVLQDLCALVFFLWHWTQQKLGIRLTR